MGTYILRRVLTLIPVLLGISLVLFTILAMAPGDPFGELATNPNVPPEVRMNLRKQFGLDDPIAVRYGKWFTQMVQGNWGFSFVSRVDVDVLIRQRLPTTLFVQVSALTLALLVSLPVGILSARRPYSIFDQIATTLALVGFSLPSFFTGLLFILFFSLYLDWLPFIYRADIQETGLRWLWENLKQGVMPITVLGLAQGAQLTRFVRAAVLDVVQLDYIRTARAKAVAEFITLMKHGVRNALIPVVTLLAIQIPQIFTGAVVTEQIFRVPGIGALLISSILSNDTPVIMGVTFVYGALVLVFGLIADIVYGWLDPRISFRWARDAGERRARGGGGRPADPGSCPEVRFALARSGPALPPAPAGHGGGPGPRHHGGRGPARPARLPRPDRRDRLQGEAQATHVGSSVRDRRSGPGHPGPDPLRRADLPGGRRRRHADRCLRRHHGGVGLRAGRRDGGQHVDASDRPVPGTPSAADHPARVLPLPRVSQALDGGGARRVRADRRGDRLLALDAGRPPGPSPVPLATREGICGSGPRPRGPDLAADRSPRAAERARSRHRRRVARGGHGNHPRVDALLPRPRLSPRHSDVGADPLRREG